MNNTKWTRESLSTKIDNAVASLKLFVNRRAINTTPNEDEVVVTTTAVRLRSALKRLSVELSESTDDKIPMLGNRFEAMVPPENETINVMTNVNPFVVGDNSE